MNQMLPVQKNLMSTMHTRLSALRARFKRLSKDNCGEGYLDMAMKILIVVVIGAAILAIMNTAMPNLFQGLISKISNELTNVSVLPG